MDNQRGRLIEAAKVKPPMELWYWNPKSRETVRTPRQMFHVKHSCAAVSCIRPSRTSPMDSRRGC